MHQIKGIQLKKEIITKESYRYIQQWNIFLVSYKNINIFVDWKDSSTF